MKIFNKWLVALMVISTVSCTGDFDEINTNDQNPTVVDPGFILTGVEGSIMNRYVFTSDLFANETGSLAQYFVKHFYTNENVYNFRGSMFNAYWNTYYNQMLRMREAAKMIETPPYSLDDEAVKTNRKAVLEILEIWTWTQITDQFGDVPYTNALQGGENFQPTYDTQEAIYTDLIARISSVVTTIDNSAGSFGNSDVIFNGDMDAWERFANSLKLRMGMRVIDANSTLGTTAVQEAAAANLISSNAQNVTYEFQNETFRSPLRRNDGEAAWDDVVIAQTYTDVVNAVEDPRRGFQMYDWGPGGTFRGFPISDKSWADLDQSKWSYSYLGWAFRYWDERADTQWPYVMMDYAEVSFLLAEAAERGVITGSADAYYTQGITASMEYWDVDPADVATYLARPDIVYSSANWKERIGTQKYIAHFPYGSEAFSEARRLDFPVLVQPLNGTQTLDLANRMLYPNDEVLLNSENTAAAISRLENGNTLTGKVWWDVN